MKSGASAIGGMALFSLPGRRQVIAYSGQVAETGFTIEVLTGDADKAVELLSGIIPGISASPIHFSEHILPGKYVGDLIFVNNNSLVNYRQRRDEISRKLAKISEQLRLPSNVTGPKLLVFSAGNNNIKPKAASLFIDNQLVERFELNDNIKEYIIKTNSGEMAMAIEDDSARILSSSCRHGTCVRTGPVRRAGQNIVCIPNRVRLSIEGYRRDGIDAVSQ